VQLLPQVSWCFGQEPFDHVCCCHPNQLAGLVGPLAIYSKGKLDNPGVDLEIPLLYNIQNEMQSFYFEVGGMFLLIGRAPLGPTMRLGSPPGILHHATQRLHVAVVAHPQQLSTVVSLRQPVSVVHIGRLVRA
jgi:hypothetical protein